MRRKRGRGAGCWDMHDDDISMMILVEIVHIISASNCSPPHTLTVYPK